VSEYERECVGVRVCVGGGEEKINACTYIHTHIHYAPPNTHMFITPHARTHTHTHALYTLHTTHHVGGLRATVHDGGHLPRCDDVRVSGADVDRRDVVVVP
jgi:hypothetical protein